MASYRQAIFCAPFTLRPFLCACLQGPHFDGEIDMVMLDGAFTLYLPILKMLESHLMPGAIIIGENAFNEAGDYIDYVHNPQNGYFSQSLRFDPHRGNELTIRTR